MNICISGRITQGYLLFGYMPWQRLGFTYDTRMASSLYLFVHYIPKQHRGCNFGIGHPVPSLDTGSPFISGRSDDYIFSPLVSISIEHHGLLFLVDD